MTHTPLNRMAKMSDKTKRAINKGRRDAGLPPIRFGAKKKVSKTQKAKRTSRIVKSGKYKGWTVEITKTGLVSNIKPK